MAKGHMLMRIELNGRVQEITARTVSELVAEIVTPGHQGAGIAVAVEGTVIPRSQWLRRLHPNDRVDILTAIQGG